MKKLIFLFLIIFEIHSNVHGQRKNAEKIYEKVNNAVVRIETLHEDNSPHGQASGVIIKSKGWVVTNYHVLGDANFLFAEHNGKEILLDSVIAIDMEKDIMIFQLHDAKNNPDFEKIPNLKIGDSDKLKVGQKIFAIGSPLGFENTITEGIISGLRAASDSTQSFIQISAPISSGSSGGAVLDDRGYLIGISNMIITGENAQNLNFAILINDVLNAAKALNKSDLRANVGDKTLYDYMLLGHNEQTSKNYLSSIIYFQKAKTFSNTEDGVLNYSIGLSFENLNVLDSAEIYYNKSLAVVKTVDANIGLGCVYKKRKQYDKAISYFYEAIRLNPNISDSYTELSDTYKRKGDIEKAMYYQQKSFELNPELRNQKK
jgi:S1-C subfamily serine protease